MKAIILMLSLLVLGTGFGRATNYPTKEIVQYKKVQHQTIQLPTNFANPFIIDQKDINLLTGKTIHHIELIYTQYAESANFNQKALNKRRISQLKKLLPQINADRPTWTWLEQTGAKTREVANTYFHGFVIHYGDKLGHAELGDFFSELAAKRNEFNVHYPDGGSFEIASGTTIKIDPNAVSYIDGSPVSGYYKLYYTEYRNQAEIALSGLPMNYNNDNFSSIGMYELRAEKDGKELRLIKPMKVDFNCTKIVDDAAFFSMNDKTGKWKKHHDIRFNQQAVAVAPKPIVREEVKFLATNALFNDISMSINWQQIDDNTTKATLGESAWRNYKELTADEQPEGIISCDSTERSFVLESDKLPAFQDKVSSRKIIPGNRHRSVKPIANDMNSTLLAEGSSDPGHTYPTIVKGLNSPNFGVYNCDQVYRIGEIGYLSPIYKNTETGEFINDGHVVCVMDLSYNGSFSFHPNNLTLNKAGRNAILLFTKEKEIYLIDEMAFAKLKLDAAQTVELPMKNVTNDLKSPSDLKRMLNI